MDDVFGSQDCMVRRKGGAVAAAASRAGPLDAKAWVTAGLDVLAADGIEAVRVEPLAKGLSVTKGSFYWHFTDRRALIDAMLAQWAEGRIAAIREQTSQAPDPNSALRKLIELYTRHSNGRGLAIELAIRALARNDPVAATAVQTVDAERLRHVATLFGRMGYGGREAEARAVMLYSYLFGRSLLDPKAVKATDLTLAVDALIASRVT
jgi:AcrR family transcriptional regulator